MDGILIRCKAFPTSNNVKAGSLFFPSLRKLGECLILIWGRYLVPNTVNIAGFMGEMDWRQGLLNAKWQVLWS